MVLLLCLLVYIFVLCDLLMYVMGVGGDGVFVVGFSVWMWVMFL